MVAEAVNPSPMEKEARKSGVQGYSWLLSEFEVSLGTRTSMTSKR